MKVRLGLMKENTSEKHFFLPVGQTVSNAAHISQWPKLQGQSEFRIIVNL